MNQSISKITRISVVGFNPRNAPCGLLALILLILTSGCGNVFSDPAPLFAVPLTVEGKDVGGAIVDTGGGFEVLLKDDFGLDIVDTADVVAFAGAQTVQLTGPFEYVAGGLATETSNGIIDATICNCNGLGFKFLRKSGLTLAIDHAEPSIYFLRSVPPADVFIPFQRPEGELSDFDTSFVDVYVGTGEDQRVVTALFDTGATNTVLREGILRGAPAITGDRMNVVVTHELLGSVAVNVGLYDTPGIPDMIIGNDVMATWGDQWFFVFNPIGGMIGVKREANQPIVAPEDLSG